MISRPARSHSDRFEREIPLFEVHSTTPVRAIFEHSRHGSPRMADSVLDLIRKPCIVDTLFSFYHFNYFVHLCFLSKKRNICLPFIIGSNYTVN